MGEEAIKDGIVHGTAGGPYCGVCGAPAEIGLSVPGLWSCPQGCDPREAYLIHGG